MNDVNTTLYACVKTVESKLGVRPKKKRKRDKIKNQSGELILNRKLKP